MIYESMNKIWALIEYIIKKIMTVLLKIVRIEWNEAQWESLFQFVKFGLVGLSNTVISYVVYVVLICMGAVYLLANVGSFVVSVLNAYYWNNKYVFVENEREQRSHLKTLIKTFITYGSTMLVLNSVLLILWIDILHIEPLIAPIINLVITIPLNFIINKVWAFKTSTEVE